MGHRRIIAESLAEAFAAGAWTRRGLTARGAEALGLPRAPRWLGALARRLLACFPRGAPDRAAEIAEIVAASPEFARAHAEAEPPLRIRRYLVAAPVMRPTRFAVPPLATSGELAAWLGLSPGQLLSLAAAQRRAASRGPRAHYHHRWIAKRSGGARLLESPKPRLKALQRRVLHDILDRVPAHAAAHGFVGGCSPLTGARPHVGRALVLRLDLRDFFASVRASRVHAIFRALGYPDAIARALTGLTTRATPGHELAEAPAPRSATDVRARFFAARALRAPHLPQGAPTSPALANLAAYRLDRRLAAAARACGARYTRYADDLTFSGDDAFARRAAAFRRLVARIAAEEGFMLRADKTRFMPRSARQTVAGIVVNEHLNVPRDAYDRLKAILHNARKHGPASQNRDGVADFRAHLTGRVAWVEAVSPARGRKLRAVLEAIDWAR